MANFMIQGKLADQMVQQLQKEKDRRKQQFLQEQQRDAQIEAKEIFLKNIGQKFDELEKKIPVIENEKQLEVKKEPNTLKYAGIGVGVLVLGYFGYKLLKK
jgi:hypothetical protein